MRQIKCGIYQISCVSNGQRYIGSSKSIDSRWSHHRWMLRRGKHTSPYLQHAWNAYGELDFIFSVLEECGVDLLEIREQHYLSKLRPTFNSITDISRRFGKEMLAKRAAALRARALLITHCPRGHAYDKTNTYYNAKGKRICRACNAQRVSRIYASETPEQRKLRRERTKVYNACESQKLKRKQYMDSHKPEKREYDRKRRELLKALAT